MGLFSKILEKLGFGDEAQAAPATPTTPAQPTAPAGGATSSPAPAGSTTQALPLVDVEAKLESLAAAHPEQLNWRVSIVDLLKLLGMDSSLSARKELASELGCPADKLADSAQMNMWLHKAVLQKLAANGGNVPKELLD